MAELVEDPVCHMKVDPARARARVEHRGKTYFFCCEHCAQKFQAEPERYLAPKPVSNGALVQLGGGRVGAAPHSGLVTLGRAGSVPAPATDKDPVCGMSVNPATAKHTLEHGGRTLYFCSPSCQEKFKAEPEKYLQQGAAPSASAVRVPPATVGESLPAFSGEMIYTCPMDPEVRQPGPGACPQCGLDLEPETVAPAAVKIEYTCPLHP